MTYLTILGFTEILCNLKLVLEGKSGKEIPESSRFEFLVLYQMHKTTPLNRGGIADVPLLRKLLAICQKSWEPSFWEVMDSCFFCICKFGSFKNTFAAITSLSELYFRFRRFIVLVHMKKVISMKYSSSTSSWIPWKWVRLDLILMMRDIYINSNLSPLTKFTNSSRSTAFKDILPWSIYQMIMKTVPISTGIVISYAIKQSIPLWIWWKVNENWDSNIKIS